MTGAVPAGEFDIGVWISLGIRIAVLALSVFIAWHARSRAFETADRYRLAVFSLMTVVGVLALLLGGAARIWPELTLVARAVGVVAGGALLVGLILVGISYMRDDADE